MEGKHLINYIESKILMIFYCSGLANSGGCLNNYTSGIVASLFELNLGQQHIDRMYQAYKERMLATCEVLTRELPQGCSMIAPKGGYFIWITLPEKYDAADLLNLCMKEEKIFFIVGSRFAAVQGEAKNCFRLSIAFHSKEKLMDAASRICQTIKKVLKC